MIGLYLVKVQIWIVEKEEYDVKVICENILRQADNKNPIKWIYIESLKELSVYTKEC